MVLITAALCRAALKVSTSESSFAESSFAAFVLKQAHYTRVVHSCGPKGPCHGISPAAEHPCPLPSATSSHRLPSQPVLDPRAAEPETKQSAVGRWATDPYSGDLAAKHSSPPPCKERSGGVLSFEIIELLPHGGHPIWGARARGRPGTPSRRTMTCSRARTEP